MLISYYNYVYIFQVASWLRDVQVKDVTNTSAIIQYTTADCVVNEIENLTIELIIAGDSPDINPSSPVLYENATMGIFNLTDLEPDNIVTYTVQVVVEVMNSNITIGMIHTGSFTVSSTPSSSATTTSTTMSTGMSSSFTFTSGIINLNTYSTCRLDIYVHENNISYYQFHFHIKLIMILIPLIHDVLSLLTYLSVISYLERKLLTSLTYSRSVQCSIIVHNSI